MLAIIITTVIFVKRTAPPLQNKEVLSIAEKIVKVKVSPFFNFNDDVMKLGVIQHVDRQYTYDSIPEELLGGLLFQGTHRPPKGTAIELELLTPATIYFFFHHQVDGGYSKIFERLKSWKRSGEFPQYDIHNGEHGLKMVMYQLEANVGTYYIPPTTKERACFSTLFQTGEKTFSRI